MTTEDDVPAPFTVKLSALRIRALDAVLPTGPSAHFYLFALPSPPTFLRQCSCPTGLKLFLPNSFLPFPSPYSPLTPSARPPPGSCAEPSTCTSTQPPSLPSPA